MKIKKLAVIVIVFSLSTLYSISSTNTIIDTIESCFSEISSIKFMKPPHSYEAKIGGELYNKPKEFYLRKRTPQEIFDSKLSSGCGDFALLFYHLIRGRGITAKIVESVQLSGRSLVTNFSGHMVVAVKGDDRWLLVDPTQKKIIDREWNPKEKIFSTLSNDYYIGFIGDFEDYEVNNGDKLKLFYHNTLISIPDSVLRSYIPTIELFTTSDDQDIKDKIIKFNRWLRNGYKSYSCRSNKSIRVNLKIMKDRKFIIYKGDDSYNVTITKIDELNFALITKIESFIKSNP